jgi:hypothetical protein
MAEYASACPAMNSFSATAWMQLTGLADFRYERDGDGVVYEASLCVKHPFEVVHRRGY